MKNVEQAKDYFAEMMADYLAEQGKQVGKWGPGALRLGLEGNVQKDHFCRLTDGLHPKTGNKLTQRQKGGRRCYLSKVLSAPKSFSIVAVIGRDDRLIHLFNQAVDDTMEAVSEYGAVRVRKGGKDEDARTGILVYARFTHDISRALDPALHAHVPVFNCTQTADGEWMALQSAPIFERRKLFSEILLGKLAEGARQLGYQIEQTKDGFEIAGVSDDLICKFSKGRNKIDEAMSKILGNDGKGHAAVRAVIAHKVRDAKNKEIKADDLREQWKKEMGEEEYEKLMILVAEARRGQPVRDKPISAKEALNLAISHLTERTSVVTDHQLLAEALAAGRGRVELAAVAAEMQKPGSGLIGSDGDTFGSRKLTTVELLRAEQRVLLFARSGIGLFPSLLSRQQRGLRQRDPGLSEEQRQAVDKLLASRDRMTLLLGKAGVGKSTSLKDLLDGIQAAGHIVVGCAAQARQVVELRSMGMTEARTLAAVLERGELAPGAVVILDEAGQVGTLDFRRLVDLVEKAGGRLILSGDHQQHGSVSAGDMLRLLARHSGCDVARIKQIRRQHDEQYRNAVEKLSEHRALEGWDLLNQAGKINELEGEERRVALAQYVADGLAQRKNMLVVAPVWDEIDRVTEAIRDELVVRGQLGTEIKTVLVSERLDFTRAQQRQTRCYAAGMEIIERRALGLPAKKMAVKEIDGDTLVLASSDPTKPDGRLNLRQVSHKASWSVHRPRELEVRVGDKLLLQENCRTRKYCNGDLVTVAGFDTDAIRLSNGRIVGTDYTQYTHGWAVTSYASQGLTADRVAISYDQSMFMAVDRRGFYVASSRGREDVRVFCDDKDFIRDQLRRRTGERPTATELVCTKSASVLPQHLRQQRLQRLRASAMASIGLLQPSPLTVPPSVPQCQR